MEYGIKTKQSYIKELKDLRIHFKTARLSIFFASGILTIKGEFGILENITQDQNSVAIVSTDENMYSNVRVVTPYSDLQKANMRVDKYLQHAAER